MADIPMVADVPPYSIISFTFSVKDTDSELVVMCNGIRLLIRLFAESFNESPPLKERYLFFLQVAEAFEIDGVTVEDFYDWIIEPFLPLLRDLPSMDGSAVPTLQDFFFPETRYFTLRGDASGLVPVPYMDPNVKPDKPAYGVHLPNELCSRWRSFSPSDLEIYAQRRSFAPPDLEICADRPETVLSGTPRTVRPVSGTNTFFLKLVHWGDANSTNQELSSYGKIDDAELDEELRIPRLHGLVRDDTGRVLGLLLTNIDCRNSTLACAASNPAVPDSQRRKWAAQVKSTVERLHAAGIIWGDVKPENVLIDVTKEAWVIDFGGGYTEGCVDKDSAGTVAGDLQGLANMMSFLGVEGVADGEIAGK
ncbi:hypothetical protein F5X97DRAFT_316191 [Nemania serpens]|nr:hypothetical protein F5X97DRAFT_316191 [Nemania serpens]